jgi:hypothetical protein
MKHDIDPSTRKQEKLELRKSIQEERVERRSNHCNSRASFAVAGIPLFLFSPSGTVFAAAQ